MGYTNLRASSKTRFGNFAALEKKLQPLLLRGAKNAANAVLAHSQGLVPVDSGDLQRSGKTTVATKARSVTGYVMYTAPYAAFVELGTGLHGMGTYPFDLPRQGVPYTGSWVYDYKRQNWIGHAAQPYLRPALDIGRADCLAAFRAALQV